MAVAGPFYFAWVNATETTFGVEHQRMDEYIFSARRILSEGEKPKLELVIENPRVGLLSPLRKQWCWFAWNNGTSIVPLFFGRIVGIPSDLQSETITVTFIAWPTNYKKQLQALAETLKVAPFYDPVFTDVSKRDDPMSLFESYSKLIDVDPVTLLVTASDIIDAEDGNVDFTNDDAFYDSVRVAPGTVPKTAVYVDASVSWTQTAHGYLDIISGGKFTGPLADGIISDWPKPGSQLAPGLTVFNSVAIDVNRTSSITTKTVSGSYQNKEKVHEDGDTLSYSFSLTSPGGAPITPFGGARQISAQSTTGVLDPFAVDEDGNPSPLNIPASVNATYLWTLGFSVAVGLTVEYHAARPHTERLIFVLQSNVQPTTLDPTLQDDSETITISGSDVGVPIIDLLNWTTISGKLVTVGTVIFPDDPQFPGGTSAQVATVAGTAGIVEPTFSDVVGETTVDGGVTWASLGVTSPTENATNWSGSAKVPTGTIILPQEPSFVTWAAFVAVTKNSQTTTQETQSVSEGTVIKASNGSYQVCTINGNMGVNTEPSFSTTWGVTTADNSVTWTSLGTMLPLGNAYFIATTGGITGNALVTPVFGSYSVLGNTFTDGTVVWNCIGNGNIPIGGTSGNVTGSTYFATTRGQRSIEHLICRARARLRYTSRCVATQFECSYAKGLSLTLRKSATLHDGRLPGGLVTGKITSIEHVADSGAFTCNVAIASVIGFAGTIEEVAGTPTFVTTGYVTTGYQFAGGAVTFVPTLSDVAYSPIIAVPDEDGISFPLTLSMIAVSQGLKGETDAKAAAGALQDAAVAAGDAQSSITQFISGGAFPSLNDLANTVPQANPLKVAIDQNQMWYELVLKPLNGNGSFNHVYHVKCTKLELPQQINLQQESTS